MRRAIALLLVFGAAACAGRRSDGVDADNSYQPLPPPAATYAGARALPEPDWFKVDHKAKTVTMDIVATQEARSWKFNGYSYGSATITVPEGYQVTINFSNEDFMPHSIGVANLPVGEWPTTLDDTPVFEGAITSEATSNEATGQGESETITFTASKAGNYALVCYVPTHALVGMWIKFNVAAGTQAGVEEKK
jgi:sulfocyanin